MSDDVALLQREESEEKNPADGRDDDEAEEAAFALSRRRARGLAGCVLIFKIAGAAAAAGLSLEEVAAVARRAADALATMGLATSACALPGLPPPAGRCRPGAVEFGMGLHGEAGAEFVDGPVSAPRLAEALWKRIEPHASRRARMLLMGSSSSPVKGEKPSPSSSSSSSSSPPSKPRAVLLVNSLGGCAVLETSALAAAALPLARSSFDVARLHVGPFRTSLDMRGASITVLPVDDELLAFIDSAVQVPAWPSCGAGACCGAGGGSGGGGEKERVVKLEKAEKATSSSAAAAVASSSSPLPFDAALVAKCLKAAASAVVAARARLDELDGRALDGDCGATLAGAARNVEGAVEARSLPFSSSSTGNNGGGLAATASAIGALVARAGGTSGGVYDIFFSAAAASLRAAEEGKERDDLPSALAAAASLRAAEEGKERDDLPSALAAALSAAAAAVSLHGGAVEGDRTLLDALLPAARAAVEAARNENGNTNGLAVARAAAESGAEATAAMAKAGAGRSAYVRSETLLGHADPGAVAVATWMRAVAEALE